MSDPPPSDPAPARKAASAAETDHRLNRRWIAIRLAIFILLLALAVAVAWFLRFTPTGRRITHHNFVRQWVGEHRTLAPVMLVGFYILLGCLLLPVWWVQVLAGIGFGLVMGVVWCQVGATLSAVLSLALSRWLIGDWFLHRVADRMAKLRKLEENLGHNGLLVVMAIRLTHVVPFGISNYLLGLTTITLMDVALGTFWGGTSTTMLYVAMGASPRALRHHHFWTVFILVNVFLLTPLVLRYLKPHWFKRIGVE